MVLQSAQPSIERLNEASRDATEAHERSLALNERSQAVVRQVAFPQVLGCNVLFSQMNDTRECGRQVFILEFQHMHDCQCKGRAASKGVVKFRSCNSVCRLAGHSLMSILAW